MIDALTKSWVRNTADEKAAAAGMKFDLARAAWNAWWIGRYCRLYEGSHAGEPVILRGAHSQPLFASQKPWQSGGKKETVQYIRDYMEARAGGEPCDWQLEVQCRIYGWICFDEHWKEWVRRFNRGIVYIGKKNKKSPAIAYNAVYLTCGDGEQGQKVYLCATTGDQAKEIAGKHAVQMVLSSPELSAACHVERGKAIIQHLASNSVLQPLYSGNVISQKAREGLNGSGLVDECFVAETIISTAKAPCRIDKVLSGDRIKHGLGEGIVIRTMRRYVREIYRLEYSDGTRLECTANHPVYTRRGWIAAGKLALGAFAFREQDLQALRREVSSAPLEKKGGQDLGAESEVLESAGILLDCLQQESEESDAESGSQESRFRHAEEDRAQATSAGRQWQTANAAADCALEDPGQRVGAGACHPHENAKAGSLPDLLQDRHLQSRPENCNRSGRPFARHSETQGGGCEENGLPNQPWLVRISRIECPRPVAVFNLRVSGHPSYFANGLLVHNCHVVNADYIGRISRMGISRKEPLFLGFSTAGDEQTTWGYQQWDFGTRNNESGEDLHFFFQSYEGKQTASDAEIAAHLDSYIRAANPALGHTVRIEEVRQDYANSVKNEKSKREFYKYRLNIWGQTKNQWLPGDLWAGSRLKRWSVPTRKGAGEKGRRGEKQPAWGAIYLGYVDEPAALTLVWPADTARIDRARTQSRSSPLLPFSPSPLLLRALDQPVRCRTYYWLPRGAVENFGHAFPYAAWEESRCCTVLPGVGLDMDRIARDIIRILATCDVQALAYDPGTAGVLLGAVCEAGHYPLQRCFEFPRQAHQRWAFSVALVERLLRGGKLKHRESAAMDWEIGHAEVKPDRLGGAYLVEPERGDRKTVAGPASLLMALDAMAKAERFYKSELMFL